MSDTTTANADQVAYWNTSAGPAWVAAQELLDAQIGALGLVAIEALAPHPGETLIDLGCGCGETTMELGRRVGASGAVVGVDISAPMLARARERCAAAGLGQVEFVQADVQTHALPPADGAYSRFGVMFFDDPAAAFANVRKALRPGGRVAFVCWRAMAENGWMTTPMAAAGDLLPAPAQLAPGAPGPFAFADRDRVRGILREAGFTDVSIDPLDRKIGWPNVDTALQIVVSAGPLAAALRERPEMAEPVLARVRETLTALAGPDGVRMDSASWIVLAR